MEFHGAELIYELGTKSYAFYNIIKIQTNVLPEMFFVAKIDPLARMYKVQERQTDILPPIGLLSRPKNKK